MTALADKSLPAVTTSGLVKSFGALRVVDGLNLSVPSGTVYGLLGPNGAGKTTTVRMLATLLIPDAGTATVFGRDVVREADAVRACVALTGQFASVDGDLTGEENLRLLCRLRGYPRNEARARTATLLEAFELHAAAKRQVKKYSGGMRRRLDIAASLTARTPLLFLDEPTTGLDPSSRAQVWDIVRAMRRSGTTVLLTTQYLEEADQLADRIAVIDGGRVVAEGTPAELKSSVGADVLRVRVATASQRESAARCLTRATGLLAQRGADPHMVTVQVGDHEAAVRALLELATAGISTSAFDVAQPTLNEVFLSLTGSRAADGDEPEKRPA